MNKLLTAIALAAILAAPVSAATVKLPVSAAITADNTYTTPTDRGGSYNLNLKGTFGGATVSLQYYNSSGQTWDELASFTSATLGYVHLAQNTEAHLVVSGSTGSTAISAEFFSAAPLMPRGAAGSPSAGVTTVQGIASGTPVAVAGPTAAGSAVTTNPVMTGLVARTANSPVINGTGIYPIATLAGAQVVKPYSIPEADWSYVPPAGGFANSATPATIIASAGAGLRNYITGLTISSDALGSACDLAVVDSSGSVFLFRYHLTTAGAPGGINITFPTPLRGPAATALTIKTLVGGSGTAVTGAIYVNAQGYQAP